MLSRTKFCFLLIAGLILSPLLLVARDHGGQVEMNLHDQRSQIRANLLKYTPPGSSSASVLNFVKTRLKHKGNPDAKIDNHPARGPITEGSKLTGVKRIKVLLGDCLDSPLLMTMDVPVPVLTEVTVQWAFDKNDRLIEIFVDRKAEGP